MVSLTKGFARFRAKRQKAVTKAIERKSAMLTKRIAIAEKEKELAEKKAKLRKIRSEIYKKSATAKGLKALGRGTAALGKSLEQFAGQTTKQPKRKRKGKGLLDFY